MDSRLPSCTSSGERYRLWPPSCRMATSKLTLVLREGFSNSSTNIFWLSCEFQPSFFIATALDISARMPSLVRSEIDRKSLLFKIASRMHKVYHERHNIQ